MDRIRKVYGSTTHDLIVRHAPPGKGGRGRRLDDAGSGATWGTVKIMIPFWVPIIIWGLTGFIVCLKYREYWGIILGLYRDNGKENGNYYLGFRV